MAVKLPGSSTKDCKDGCTRRCLRGKPPGLSVGCCRLVLGADRLRLPSALLQTSNRSVIRAGVMAPFCTRDCNTCELANILCLLLQMLGRTMAGCLLISGFIGDLFLEWLLFRMGLRSPKSLLMAPLLCSCFSPRIPTPRCRLSALVFSLTLFFKSFFPL